ncbi:MAG: PilN domain-containing protein [Solirubrobacterales bacterium]
MRPVNLIPTEQRRGERTPMRSGPVAYLLLGALVAALFGVTALVIANNQVSEHKAEIVELEEERATVEEEASALSSYVQFHGVSQGRDATVASLADSRFDWERVMRELSLVLPGNVWLTNLTATASPQVSVGSGSAIPLRASVAGPALELFGCASSQDAVAGFVQALKDIDGATRVGVESSAVGGGESEASGDSASTGSSCQTRAFIAQFQILVAFDAAPVSPAGGAGEAPVEAAPEEPAAESTTSTEE